MHFKDVKRCQNTLIKKHMYRKVTQQWLLSQPDSGLKSESSESFNFIEKSNLVQLWPQNPPRLWRPLVSEHQVDFDQQLPKFEIDLNCISNLNLEMYMWATPVGVYFWSLGLGICEVMWWTVSCIVYCKVSTFDVNTIYALEWIFFWISLLL